MVDSVMSNNTIQCKHDCLPLTSHIVRCPNLRLHYPRISVLVPTQPEINNLDRCRVVFGQKEKVLGLEV
jgi:hypothetical protein